MIESCLVGIFKLLLTIIREIIYSSFARKVNKFVSFLNLFKKNYDINITSWNDYTIFQTNFNLIAGSNKSEIEELQFKQSYPHIYAKKCNC